MYDSGVGWEGLGWRNKSIAISIQDVYETSGPEASNRGVCCGKGEVQGLTSRELQHVDIRKMREKETAEVPCGWEGN